TTLKKFKSSEIFEKISQLVTKDVVKQLNCVYQFNITSGTEKASWTVDLKNGKVSPTSAPSPDCTLEMNDEDCVAIMTGKMDSTEAFFDGRLKIDGDMGLAMKLNKLQGELNKIQDTNKEGERGEGERGTGERGEGKRGTGKRGKGISVPGFKASEIFENVKALLEIDSQRLIQKINGIYQFNITKGDSEKQSWTIDLKESGKISLGES